MITVNVVYDGKKVKFLEKPGIKASVKTPRKGIITFLDDDTVLTAAEKKNLNAARRLMKKGGHRKLPTAKTLLANLS